MIEFNLVPKNLRHRSRTGVNWLRVGTIFAVAMTALAVSGSVLNQMSLAIYREELKSQEPGIRAVDDLERQLRDARRENQRIADEVARLQILGDRGETEQFLRFFDALAAVTTEGILLEYFEYNRGGTVLVTGVAIDPEEVSRYFEQVKQLGGVQEASLSQLRRPAGDESSLRRFELRLRWEAGG